MACSMLVKLVDFLITRCTEYDHRMKMRREIDIFLYGQLKHSNHYPSQISIQPVVNILYDDNSTEGDRSIFRYKLEVKWIKALQTPHPLGFMIIFTMTVIFPDYQILVCFSFRYSQT